MLAHEMQEWLPGNAYGTMRSAVTTFLFTTLPTNDLGLLTRALPIADEVAKLGHRVLFSSPAAAPRRLVFEAGFANLVPRHPIYELLDVDRNLFSLIRFLVARKSNENGSLAQFLKVLLSALPIKNAAQTSEVWDTDHAGAMMGMLNEGFVRAHCEAFRELIRDCDPDVLVDFWNPFAVVAARAENKAVVTVIQSNAHPDGGGFLYWKTQPADSPSPARVMNRVLKDYGLPTVNKVADLSVGDLTLVVGMPETDPLPASAQVHYLGGVLWQAQKAELPPEVSGLPSDKPVAWIYCGNPRYSSSDDTLNSEVVLYACKEALADMDMHVVLTTGHHPIPKKLLPLPKNFHSVCYVPGLAMSRRADLLIHHGGYGSCQTGLYTGKPAVILPTYSERLSNARRLATAGAARIVEVSRLNGVKTIKVAELREAVTEVLHDPSYAANARRLSEQLRRYGGAKEAAKLIGELSRRRSTETC